MRFMAILQPSKTNVQYRLIRESLLHIEYLNIVFDTYLVPIFLDI
jgi:hypothetical protein